MLRNIKILLIVSIGMWGALGAYGNIHGWSGTIGAVGATTSMAAFEGGADDWRATSNPIWITMGAVMIPTLKIAAAFLCFAGAWTMWKARKADAAIFQKAKTMALSGCGLAMFMLFMGWIVIAETWYEAWQSDLLREQALQSAFRYCGMIGVMALFVGMKEE